jgi:hypothetical protein
VTGALAALAIGFVVGFLLTSLTPCCSIVAQKAVSSL